ncbi:adenosylcobinamide-GDP ribazoletransferase [Rhodococcus sp. PvR044]|uniref:adenosylcobinamide-GDP ribazoletransferase n=1 Tax=unclassified Rhodococcus (in: high G+C Gram-positive bacteria) TaxID=192944 RepID=UPI000BC8CE77|nr:MULTISPECIES: adenosylcobinamide-GDP ribazoletransferase [unclassified Rhodococcus (in: high G+C Gram-positive bacteria)]MBP1159288.1 adenosylcobinamide-GDP ribazoletransferase [Rhodococcus sp. PvR099]PTR41935.1 cobalamin-5'-phosphate synthase [Rhodococcus sp. OK611]SNX91618.1 cobalamin-5'-phosphate synthase [Rhodococcus sp. OK270]
MTDALGGIRLALSWLTVLPARHDPDAPAIDRTAGRRAIAATPVVGMLLGAACACLLWLLLAASLDPALAGLIAVTALALLTRGMHVDGLADTVDGLGCYGPPARALEVMRGGGIGPFGVVALIVCIGAQALSFGSLAQSGQWIAIGVAVAAGRVAVVLACRRGVPAAGPTGFGALVADSQGRWSCALWSLALTAAALFAVPGRWWQGPVVVLAALAATALLTRHCVRRFGGVTGDVLGAAVEVTVTVVAVGALLAG